jgi:uncharacterized protein (TIGR02117 family)
LGDCLAVDLHRRSHSGATTQQRPKRSIGKGGVKFMIGQRGGRADVATVVYGVAEERGAGMIAAMRRRSVLILSALALLVLAYPLAAFVGSLLPSNANWSPPPTGVTLYIESNGIHTGIIMPKVAAGVDWRSTFPARDLRDPRYAAYDHVSVGWGERDFYLQTPTWADLRPGVILAAAIGSNRTLVHVDHLPAPKPGGDVRQVVVRPAEYRRLAAFIQASLVPDGTRQPGYFGNDAFYQARGRYDAFHTCNDWIGDALRFAGVRVGRWTPFPGSVLRWFPRHD